MPFTSHTLHLTARGTDEASRWYRTAFGAEELVRLEVPGGRLIHVRIRIGDLTLMLADEFPELESYGPEHFGGTYGAVYLHTDDVDAAWQRAVDAGATVLRPLADTYWGEREGQVLDPFGHRWGLTQHLRDVPHAELQARTSEAFAGLGG
ncbi:VOC family protein [Streptomyces sp. SID5785]|uniref:VOC family protein n=1 Tax=Streptomyces sp. SID5785 TaxID=2690309 RepID=UPI001360CE81|nr:VOC family protein [Streptomyces sp. SID5785]MZD06379.1 VOC family protein [Streptomyces sp. SID5785]